MASDYFLKLTDIEGESQDSKHKNEIDILSFRWGAEQPGTSSYGGGAGSGKVQIHDFYFTTATNKATPKLMLSCANGGHIASAVLTVRKAGKDQQEYLTYTMSNCIVSSFITEGNGDTVLPVDQFKLNFGKIECLYKQQSDDGTLGGSVKAGWDVKGNKAV